MSDLQTLLARRRRHIEALEARGEYGLAQAERAGLVDMLIALEEEQADAANAKRRVEEERRVASGELCSECRNTRRDPLEPHEPCTWCNGGRARPISADSTVTTFAARAALKERTE